MKEPTDAEYVQAALFVVANMEPRAISVMFETTDQQIGYGFRLNDVILSDEDTEPGLSEARLDQIAAFVEPLICEIKWDGAMGEDGYGYVTMPLR